MKNFKSKKDNGTCGNCGDPYPQCECPNGPNKD